MFRALCSSAFLLACSTPAIPSPEIERVVVAVEVPAECPEAQAPEYTHCLWVDPAFEKRFGELGLRIVEGTFLLYGARVEFREDCSAVLSTLPINALGATKAGEWIWIDSDREYWIDTPYNGGYEFGTVVAHEVAHFLGYSGHAPFGLMGEDIRPGDSFAVTGDERSALGSFDGE